MLAYRHQFHAGNFADVFKHALLVRLLLGLARKDKPYFYLDTHAGIGRYDLTHPWAQKLDRISRRHRAAVGASTGAGVGGALPGGRARGEFGRRTAFLSRFPGLARRLLRPGDRIVLTELNRDDCLRLHRIAGRGPAGARRMHGRLPSAQGVSAADGTARPGADRLPPSIAQGSSTGSPRHWWRRTDAGRRGCFALWYPLMEAHAVQAFERGVVATGIRKILKLELLSASTKVDARRCAAAACWWSIRPMASNRRRRSFWTGYGGHSPKTGRAATTEAGCRRSETSMFHVSVTKTQPFFVVSRTAL